MKVTITAKKMQVPQNFPEYAENKLNSKLSKFFGDEAEAKITMSEYKNQIILELTVKYNRILLLKKHILILLKNRLIMK